MCVIYDYKTQSDNCFNFVTQIEIYSSQGSPPENWLDRQAWNKSTNYFLVFFQKHRHPEEFNPFLPPHDFHESDTVTVVSVSSDIHVWRQLV